MGRAVRARGRRLVRIVAGTLRGRTIDGPKWDGLRPTSDSLRETLFNVLGPSIAGARVLDAFAGTGAVGIEAVSRGAAHATFVERDPRAITLIEHNITKLGVKNACAIIRGDFMRAPASLAGALAKAERFDLAFLDPPYELPDLDDAIRRAGALLAPGGRVVAEHSRRREPAPRIDGLSKYRTLTAGDSALSFYTAVEGA
ncbi:MAG: 16S rRNA (guanine(966)-N(2))-methyltransferase RsmD [Acidobacteria bacterium]|nr:MAG: 16S rRNA (guanine(966)-N(2))-methyltransferase RsmD [Acidobacteriota bacterium]